MGWRRWWPRSLVGRVALVVGAVFVGIPAAAVVIGLLVGLIGAALGLVLGFGWPFLLVFGVYKLVSSQQRSVAVPYSVVPAGTWAPSTAAPPPPPAPPPDPFARLPDEVRTIADRIYWKATSLLQSGRFPAGSRNLHLVQRTRDQYLPWTLHSYLAIPPGSDDRVAAPDGRTTIQVVRDQLSVLETKLDEVTNDLWQADVQRLLANERFLEEHFGRREPDELRIP